MLLGAGSVVLVAALAEELVSTRDRVQDTKEKIDDADCCARTALKSTPRHRRRARRG
jgi:hypothetical protein